ncbi:MAG: DUF2202 domain-containing protein [Eubacteriales bacterium]|nr:DUF2202 domain-containing protein [Eubacteriales bacterium]
MKQFAKITTALTLSLALTGAFGMAVSAEELTGAAAADADTSYTIEDMLTYAIQDEFNAKAEYAAIQDEFGTVRVYSNIEKAEDKHIAALMPLLDAYDVAVPAQPDPAGFELPATLAETYAIGVTAEVLNIGMYEKFLAQELPDDIRFVFENLMKGSENHLAAFERLDERVGLGGTAGTGALAQNGNDSATRGNSSARSANRGVGGRGR